MSVGVMCLAAVSHPAGRECRQVITAADSNIGGVLLNNLCVFLRCVYFISFTFALRCLFNEN